jgi:hypothetical protein
MVAEGIIVMRTTENFMKPFQMSWLCFTKIRTYSRVCSTLRTTSAAVVAPLTFNTYFSLAGNAYIDYDEDGAQQARQRHYNIDSYFIDEEDDQSSTSGGEKVDDKARNDEEHGSNEDEPPLDTFFLPPFSDSRFCSLDSSYGTRKTTPAVTSPLMGSTQPAISSERFTIPPKKLL